MRPPKLFEEITMEASKKNKWRKRLLCLGNDILADDGLGPLAAEAFRKRAWEGVEVVDSSESGFHLMDYLMDTDQVIVVDSIQTGKEYPGKIYHLKEKDLPQYQGNSPHYVGLLESLQLGRELKLDIAKDLQIIAIETADCHTLGGEMHPDVRASVPKIVDLLEASLS